MMAAGPALRWIFAPVVPGRYCSGLTLDTVEAWVEAVHRDPRRLAWVANQLGPSAVKGWRALGLYPQRIVTLAGGSWAPAQPGEAGTPAVIVPQWDIDLGAHSGRAVVELVAIDPRAPASPIARDDMVDALGWLEAARAIDERVPIIWHADALSWLRAGGNGERYLGEPLEAAQFFPFAIDTALADRVLLEAGQVVAMTAELGEQLAERAAELRRAAVPPRVDIHVASSDLEA